MRDESRSFKVLIFGKEYEVRSDSDKKHLDMLASHVDSVMRDISKKTENLSLVRVAILAALNIANELYRERERCDEFARKLEQELEKALGIADDPH